MTSPVGLLTGLVDAALDRSVVLGYTSIGSGVRRAWWPADPEPQALAGRRVLVTGATSGIGEAMARSFVDLGAAVHLLGRNADKLRGVAADLRVAVPNAEVVEEVCDIADLAVVSDWADDFTSRVPQLHGLVHNAGVITSERQQTAQGHEMTLTVHVLGPHLITERLEPALRAGGPSMVVWMSSGGMYSAGLRDTEPGIEYRDGAFSGIRAYARTKRMQVVLADHWSQRLAGSGIQVESMHPGWVDTPGVANDLAAFGKVVGPLLRTPADGADTAVWLVATRPTSQPRHFWHDRAQRPTTLGWQRDEDAGRVRRFLGYVDGATRVASDPRRAQRRD